MTQESKGKSYVIYLCKPVTQNHSDIIFLSSSVLQYYTMFVFQRSHMGRGCDQNLTKHVILRNAHNITV